MKFAVVAAAILWTASASAQTAAPAPSGPAAGGAMVVNLLGPVTSESMADLVSAGQDAMIVGAEELQVRISSGGGKVYAVRFAVNALAALPIRLTTVAMSDVSSSAVALFCAGEQRSMAPGATIYLHQLTRFAERSAKTATAQEREDEIVHGWYDDMLRGCLKDPDDMAGIESYKDRDLILDRDDAYRLGLANTPFEALREKRYFGRATNIVPRSE